MSDNVSKLPDPMVDLDLDDYEETPEEKAKAKRPYAFKLNGRRIEMNDPENLDWRDLALITEPLQFVKLCLSDEDRRWFFEQPDVNGKKFSKIMEGFNAYYGLDKKMAEAQRQQRLAGA